MTNGKPYWLPPMQGNPNYVSSYTIGKPDDAWGTGVERLQVYYGEGAGWALETQLHRTIPAAGGPAFVHSRIARVPGALTPLKLRLSHASWTAEMEALPLFRTIAVTDWLRFSDPMWIAGRRLWERTNVL